MKKTNDYEEENELDTGLSQNPVKDQYPIVAMGGSAGSLHAFESFFKLMPIDSGIGFVIIMHLPAVANIDVAGLIQRFTPMPVIEAIDGTIVLANHVYVIPPNKDMGIHKSQLLLFKLHKNKVTLATIDFFFQSLAESRGINAVGIILSGLGNDGELGVKKLKEKLGMVMVQDPESAQFKSMPNAAVKTGMADFILPVEQMPNTLIKYFKRSAVKYLNDKRNYVDIYQHTMLQKILLLLRAHIGHDFTLYKRNTINRRIERRMTFRKLSNFEQYFDYINENPLEMDALFKELLIGVTKFFRDPESYDSLKDELYQKIDQKGEEDTLRIWIAGCSTGEESYSVAMLLLEYFDKHQEKKKIKIQMFATDLDSDAIEFARIGFYNASIAEDVSKERLERFFNSKNNGYVVKKELREVIVFAKHNLIKDAPFTRLDLLSCRNVMIYFSASLQKKLLPVFHYSLKPNGILFLGPAETVGVYNDAFKLLDSKWKIFEPIKGMNNIAKMIDFPFEIATPDLKVLKNSSSKPQIKNPMANSFHKILIDHYTPASLLVNERGDILYINGNMNRYLQLNSGEAIMNLYKIVREELKYPLGNAIHQANLHKKSIGFTEIKIKENGKTNSIEFAVDYLSETDLKGLLVITFKDNGEVRKRRNGKANITDVDLQTITDLEKELGFTKQQLNTTVEQMESSLEELKSTNEELQSTNEELQSTNEEALTTKEEMQSLNEELMTINLQYHNKAEELTRLNNDMKNLLDNTEIGTIFLDNNLNILRFTPQVTKLFNVIPQDVGRSITHIVSNFEYPSLEQAIGEVIERLAGKELEVKTKKNDWYNLRIMPYRTMDNFISGAVLTFTKITPLKSLENRLITLLSYVQTVVDNLNVAAVILDKDQKILVVNKPFLKLFHLKEFEVKEHFLMEIVVNRWKTNKLLDLVESEKTKHPFYLEHEFPELGLLKLMISVNYIKELGLNENTAIIVKFEKQGNNFENGNQ